MLVFRILVFVLLAWVAWQLYRRIIGRNTPKQPGDQSSMEMIACKRCGTHVPQDEAIQSDGEWFCCSEHRDHFLRDSNEDHDG